jgi:HD superfamily phosphohydrolase
VRPDTENDSSKRNKKKIFNDPIYGLINFPHDILYELIDHPYVQRLRRIKQLGLTDYVYSGGSHSRFNHCIGALHLMTQAIGILKWKGVEITEDEEIGASIAILLHDIGHGPFSHALEGMILPFKHEKISLRVMELLNETYDGKLQTAISIFTNQYHKPFLHQLVASQIDMDRMDFLNRDSFYTGVVEGMIGYDRIIKMMHVVNGNLVIEEKGVLSVEQFLMARRMMYWQVYLHKTVLAAEKMLQRLFELIHNRGYKHYIDSLNHSLLNFFRNFHELKGRHDIPEEFVEQLMHLDDTDIIYMLKSFATSQNGAPQLLAKGILDRHIFKIILKNDPISTDLVNSVRMNVESRMNIASDDLNFLLIQGSESSATYNRELNEILILHKNGAVKALADQKEILVSTKSITKYFIIFPRIGEMDHLSL